MDAQLIKWREEGNYLPDIMKDFHDQKDIFKAIHEMTKVEEHEYAKNISWVAGQCYVIDIFLWFMARHGYTLQRSRAHQKFDDLHAHVKLCKDHRDREAAIAMGLHPID